MCLKCKSFDDFIKTSQHQIAKCFEILTVVANDSNRMNELTSWKVDTIATDFYDREKSKYKKGINLKKKIYPVVCTLLNYFRNNQLHYK